MRILNPTFNKTKKLIVLALVFVFFNNMLNSQGNLVLEFDDEQAGETNVTSPLNSEVDVVFDWGDGDRESFTSSDGKNHTNIDEIIFHSIGVFTHEISEITPSTAMSGGKVVADDENSLGDYGVVWGTKPEPTLHQNVGYTIDGTGVGAFESRLTKLNIGGIYYVRAYSKNEVVHEVIYGEQFRFRATQEINIDGSFIAQNKVYDGTIDVEIDSEDLSLDNIVADHDDVSLVNVIAEFEDANAGSDKTVSIVSAELTGSDAFKYRLSLDNAPTAEADIKPEELNVINAEVQNKIYDGNTEAEIMGAELSGVITGDTITFENYEAGNFVQTAAGEGIDVTTEMEISGEAVSNYTLTQPSGLKADITQKELTIINAQPNDKIYDGNTEAEIMGAELSGVITGDNVTPENHKSGTFAQATVGENINITTEMDISGDAVSNYTLTQPSGLKADITQKELTVINAEAQNKNYDGNTEAIISGAELSGVVTGDNVTLDNHKTGTFAQAAVGGNIAVTTAITINGIDTQNYDFKNPTGHRANIYQKEISIKGSFTVNDKEHNGTTSAEIDENNLELEGVVSDDDVELVDVVAEFEQAEAGTDITVAIVDADIDGENKGNYTLSLEGAPTTTASITKETGINVITEVNISVYPNPARENFNIKAGSKINRIVVSNMAGSVVYKKAMKDTEARISTTNFDTGLYVIRIYTDKGVFQEKMQVQK